MKLPIWAFNKTTDKYELFPFDLLDVLQDGTQGFAFPVYRDNHSRQEAFMKFRDYFEYNPIAFPETASLGFQYRLRKQP